MWQSASVTMTLWCSVTLNGDGMCLSSRRDAVDIGCGHVFIVGLFG